MNNDISENKEYTTKLGRFICVKNAHNVLSAITSLTIQSLVCKYRVSVRIISQTVSEILLAN